jgi:hypothetical protein
LEKLPPSKGKLFKYLRASIALINSRCATRKCLIGANLLRGNYISRPSFGRKIKGFSLNKKHYPIITLILDLYIRFKAVIKRLI